MRGAGNLKRKTSFVGKYFHLGIFFILFFVGVVPLLYGFGREVFSLGRVPEHFVLSDSKKGEVLGIDDGTLSFTTGVGYGTSNGGVIVLSAAEEPKVQIDSYNIRATGNFNLYQVSKADFLNYLVYRQSAQDEYQSSSIERVYQLDTNQLLAPTNFQAEIYASEENSQENPITLPLSGTGIWFLKGEAGSVEVETMIVRSNLAGIIHEGNNENIFWIQDSNYQSVPGAQVELLNLQNGINNLGLAATNEGGITTAAVNERADVALVTKDTDFTIIPINLENLNYRSTNYSHFNSSFTPRAIDSESFMFTDRFLYKPGDTVFFKAILRDDDDADYSIPQKAVTVIFGNDDDPIWVKTVAVDALGTVDGAIPIPSGLEPGYYSLNIKEGEEYLVYSSVQVAKYRKPDSEIRISADKLMYLPGETVTAEISGTFFLGQPIKNQELRYKVYQSPAYVTGSYDEVSFEARTQYYGGSEEAFIEEGTVTLDSKGKATLTLKAKNKTGVRQFWNIVLEYLDAGSSATNDAIQVLVQPGDFVIEKRGNESLDPVAQQPLIYPLGLFKNKADAKISGIRVTGSLQKSQEDNTYVTEQDNLEAVSSEDGGFEITVTPQQKGSYKLVLEATDAAGNLIKGEESLYVYTEAPTYSEDILEVTTDKKEYRPGETARVTVKTKSEIKNLFVSLGRSYSRAFQVLSLNNGAVTFETVIPENYQPNFYIYTGSFFKADWESETFNVPVNTDDKEITVDISFSEDSYKPGDTAEVDVTATDGLGNPVQTDLAFWLFDKALLELHGVYFEGIFNDFWHSRSFSMKTNYSYQGIYNFGGAEGGGGGGGGPRSAFKDTAYWNAHVTTDTDGKAHLSIELPDNLTTWVAAAVAANGRTQVGEGMTEITVSKDVVIRPILPGFLRSGDEITFASFLYNFTPNKEEFSVTASFTGGAIDEDPQTIAIGGEDFGEFHWPTKITNQLEEAEFTVSAQGVKNTSLIDEVIEKIPVYEYGSWESQFQKGGGAVQFPVQLSSGADSSRTAATLQLRTFRYPQFQDMVIKDMLPFGWGATDAADSLVAASILTQFGAVLHIPYTAEEVNAAVKKSMAWLAGRQDAQGIWEAQSSFDPQLNGFVLEALARAEKSGLPIDRPMTEKALAYFQNWNATYIGDIAAKQYVLSHFDNTDPARKEVSLEDIGTLSPTALAQAVLANSRLDNFDSETSLTMLDKAAFETDTQYAWREFGDDKSYYSLSLPTAFGVRAMMMSGGDMAKVEMALDYLYRNEEFDNWQQATQAIATVDYFELAGELSPDYSYTVLADDTVLRQGQISSAIPLNQVTEIELPATLKDISQVEVQQTGTGGLYSTLEITEFFTDRELFSEDHNLYVTRQYLSPKETKSPAKPGDLVIVQFDVYGLGVGETAVEIEDYLPAGLVAVDESLDNGEFDESGINTGCVSREVTDQGVSLSFCHLFSDHGTYSYKARIVSMGRFDVPPAVVKLTNEPSIWARTDAIQLLVDGKHSLELVARDSEVKEFASQRMLLAVGIMIVLGVIAFVKKDELPMIIQRFKNARKPQNPQ